MRVLTLTGPSGSGKSTLAKKLKELGFKSPIQFTTRPPRGDKEMDEYVFLKKEDFFVKMNNGDFVEFAKYGANFYAISKYFPDGNVLMVVDPVGREAIRKHCKENKIPIVSIFIEITESTLVERLGLHRRENVKTIEERKKDILSFSPVGYDFVIDGNSEISVVERKLMKALDGYGFFKDGV